MSFTRRFVHMLARVLVAAVCLSGFSVGCMIVQQEKMIYLPRQYSEAERGTFKSLGLQALTFHTSQGKQVAYWLPPTVSAPETPNIWLSVAKSGSEASGWLFIDYPSYGSCAGKPTPETIRETAEGAIQTLAAILKQSPDQLRPKLGAFGHSIGSAAALEIAAETRMKRVVIVSPFTSMKAMAARYITPMLTGFLRHRFDNRATLDKVASNGARVMILHGSNDRMIPASMGRSLAERHPDRCTFIAIEGAGHNDVIHLGDKQIALALQDLE